MSIELLNWLLEDENPAIKYRTLVEIKEKNPEDHKDCYEKIWNQKQILKLLSNRNENGLITRDKNDPTPLGNLEIFAEYGLSRDERLDKNAECSINEIRSWKKRDIDFYSCYAPNRLRSLVMLGYTDNNTKELIYEFVSTQIYDGGFICNKLLNRKPSRKSCYKAAVPALFLYAECKRKNIMLPNTDNLVNYFMKRDVFFSSDKKENLFFFKDGSSPKFSKFGVPLIVSALSILGRGNDKALQKAWIILKERENENGRLRLDGSAKSSGFFGKDGYENKWATFYALLAEKYRVL